MTKLLYAINEAEEYKINLNHTYHLNIVAENIIEATKLAFNDLGTDTIYNYHAHHEIKTSELLESITNALSDDEAKIELGAQYDDFEFTIEFEKEGKNIYFRIVSFGSTNYYYQVKTVNLDADEDLIFL